MMNHSAPTHPLSADNMSSSSSDKKPTARDIMPADAHVVVEPVEDDDDDPWMTMFQGLVEYHRVHNTFKIPRQYGWKGRNLYEWTRNQRKHYLNGLRDKRPALAMERVGLLQSIGFEFDPTGLLGKNDAFDDKRWVVMYEGLAEYSRNHGTCAVPIGYTCDGRSLHDWIRHQRKQYSNTMEGKRPALSKERTDRLLALGFDLDPTGRRQDRRSDDERWDIMFEGLVTYHQRNGTFVIPEGFFHDGRSLFSWAHNQRRLYTNYQQGTTPTLLRQRIDRLHAIGFIEARCSEVKASPPRKQQPNASTEDGKKRQKEPLATAQDTEDEQASSVKRLRTLPRTQASLDTVSASSWATDLALATLSKYQGMTCQERIAVTSSSP
jgi:hypothetical protein